MTADEAWKRFRGDRKPLEGEKYAFFAGHDAGQKAEREAILKLFEEKDYVDIEPAIRARGE